MSHIRERAAVIVLLCVLLYATASDILEDLNAGDGLSQIALDLMIILLIAALLIYVYVLEPLKTHRENQELEERSREQTADLLKLSQVARKQLDGLGVYIKAQFNHWDLTAAEQDVALMLLKGFSLKEISQIRKVSERTTRQQATTIYGKAGISGRAGLSAFFLEDLLLPSEQ